MRALTVVAVLGAMLALAGCGGGGEEAAPPAEETPRATPAEPAQTETATVPAPAAPVTIRIEVRDGRPIDGIARPRVRKGDQVVLIVTADVPGDVHLHGYDLERPVRPGAPARIRFRATVPGRFALELHAQPEVQVGELTVAP